MERHHKRHLRQSPLNLVSLMDIFTILVFFLLVNSSDVEVLPNSKAIELPQSVAAKKPRETVVVMITDKDILVQGRRVASVVDSLKGGRKDIPDLEKALRMLADRMLLKAPGSLPEVTIMGDRKTPYRLMRKVMLSCTNARYGKVSLAVLQKGGDSA